jgi:hypothetical protein
MSFTIAKYFILTLVIFIGVFLMAPSNTYALKIMRQADCGKDQVCSDAFKKQKESWLKCLEAAGISEKKRKKLSAKVEIMGIRNLKKQEILIFDSGRKQCHKYFYKTLLEISKGENKEPRFPLDTLPGNL